MSSGYSALRESAAWIDLSGRGKIKVTGEDRARLLHALSTNHVQQLTPGTGCYTFFLNAQGRIQADANILCFADHFLIDTEPETHEKLLELVDRYIIADDVTLEDVTAGTATIAVEGPRAVDSLAALGAPVPDAPYGHLAWEDRRVARVDSTGAGGCFIFLPAGGRMELIRQLEAAGIDSAGAEDARVVRLEHGRPRYGEDITEDYVPQETQVLRAVHFNKGCYIGQEIVERIRSRGHVNRLLVRLELEAPHPPARGAALPGGAITSAAYSPALGKVVALGYVRADTAARGTEFLVDGAPAKVV